MRSIRQRCLVKVQCATDAAQWSMKLACALVACCVCTQRLSAQPSQSSQLHAAFNEAHENLATDKQFLAPELRIASSPNTATQAPKTTPPANSKKGATQSRVRRSPAIVPPQTTGSGSEATIESLPIPPLAGKLPLAGSDAGAGLQLTKNNQGLITLVVRDKPLSQVLALIAQTQDLNIVASNDIDALISITLRDVPIEEALTAILSVANYTWVKQNNIILITSLTNATKLPADVQGRQVQVFDLDFASATSIKEMVDKLLSPIGIATIAASNPTNNKLTQERIVVEDLPETLARIADYIAQVDQPPRQVLIEAHVLDVKLNDKNSCGVDFNAFGLNGIIDSSGTISSYVPRVATNGLASSAASPAFVATLGNKSLGAVIELLEETTDAKSLGSPKLLVLNEQEARIQVGETIYYSQTTTTETSTQQGAGSVETGVILRITPRITRDHRVLLHVAPEVSTPGQRETPDLPPDTSTTTLVTDVMLNDNQGMVIGGLIQEKDSTDQKKIPYLGNVKGIGFLFRRSIVEKERHEIIVALVPRIQPYDKQYHDFEQGELVRSSVPLYHGPLCRTDRSWDPILPDGKRVYYPLIPKKKHGPPPSGYFHDIGSRYDIPPYPLPMEDIWDDSCMPWGPTPVDVAPQGPTLPSEDLPPPSAEDGLNDSEIISDQ